MKPIITGVLAAIVCCAAGVSQAQTLRGAQRSIVPLPTQSNVSGKKAVANTRHRSDVYADSDTLGPWIDDTSVRDKKQHRSW